MTRNMVTVRFLVTTPEQDDYRNEWVAERAIESAFAEYSLGYDDAPTTHRDIGVETKWGNTIHVGVAIIDIAV